MTKAQLESMRDRLLDLAQRLEQSTGLGASAQHLALCSVRARSGM